MDSSIYIEGVLFVVVFGLMSIISIIISKRNAKKYELENPLEKRREARKKEQLQKGLDNISALENDDKITKLLELSKMLDNEIITKEEFQSLKKELLD